MALTEEKIEEARRALLGALASAGEFTLPDDVDIRMVLNDCDIWDGDVEEAMSKMEPIKLAVELTPKVEPEDDSTYFTLKVV